MSDDLVTFYAARLDEDEVVARDAIGESAAWRAESYDYGTWAIRADVAEWVADKLDQYVAAHVARHDPARVLREAEAGRATLAYYENAQAKLDHIVAHPGEMSAGDEGVWLGKTAASRMAVRFRAAVYSDHPDYQQEWKP